MPFCENCGAQLSGDFCTACGIRAKAGDGPAAGQAAPSAPRKTSPLVWILVAVLGLFLVGGIAVVGGGLFLVHKAKQAGLDPDLMRDNPGLATAKLLAATNPDLEVVSTDDRRGLITLRQKSTGKTMTVNFDEIKQGKITFKENGKDAVTFEAHGDGQTGTMQMKSGSESLSLGANQAAMPAWIPVYPNSKPQSNFSMNTKEGTSSNFQFQTQDSPKDIIAFYERGLRQNGFKITATSTSQSDTSVGGLVTAEDEANKRNVLVTVGTANNATTVSITCSQK